MKRSHESIDETKIPEVKIEKSLKNLLGGSVPFAYKRDLKLVSRNSRDLLAFLCRMSTDSFHQHLAVQGRCMSQADPSAEVSWRVVLDTLQFAEDQFERWGLARLIPSDCYEHVIEDLREQRREYETLSTQGNHAPTIFGVIPLTSAETEDVQALRRWMFLQHKVSELKSPKLQLPLAQLHALEKEVSERLSSISRRLSNSGVDVRGLEASCVVQAILVDDETDDADATSPTAANPQ